MTALRPFALLFGRPSVFWMGAIALLGVSLTVAGLAGAEGVLRLHVDATFIAAFVFPGAAGRLAGAVIQEFQHTSFAGLLPGMPPRIRFGFLVTGIAATAIVVGTIALWSSSPQNLPVLFVVGLGAYCLGGILYDPLSAWVSTLNLIVVLIILVSSRDVARLAADRPWLTAVVSVGVAAACLHRLFARSTFRRAPFRAMSPLPGSYSAERARQYEILRRAKDGPRRTGWRSAYLGDRPWNWVRAAFHEAHGGRGWKVVSRSIGRAWGLVALIALYAWADKGDLGYGEALARSLFDAIFRSPYEPQFGVKGGPFLALTVVIGIVGFLTAAHCPVALGGSMAYPLSRRQRAQVQFRGGLVDAAILLFIIGPLLFALGHLMGWFAGYEPRFDFMPFFLRALMITLVLMPLGYWGRVRVQAAMRRKSANTMIGFVFGMVCFVGAVIYWTLVLPRLIPAPLTELATLIFALVISQLAYRLLLTRYYRAADLA